MVVYGILHIRIYVNTNLGFIKNLMLNQAGFKINSLPSFNKPGWSVFLIAGIIYFHNP